MYLIVFAFIILHFKLIIILKNTAFYSFRVKNESYSSIVTIIKLNPQNLEKLFTGFKTRVILCIPPNEKDNKIIKKRYLQHI